MSNSAHLWLFFVLVFGAVILPGLDMAFILGSALTRGRGHGLAAVGGAIAGAACHSVIATLGVGLLLETFPRAFNALLIVGAAYIAWIGIGILRGPPAALHADATARIDSIWQSFRRELANNLLNPNAYLFSLAVFPQFIVPNAGPIALQAVVLWAIIAATQAGVYGTMVLAAAQVRHWLFASASAQRRVSFAVGATLIVVAIVVGCAGWKRL